MSEDRERIQLRCSNCTRELGTIPDKESMDTELICPHCGAVVTPPSPIERLATEVKKAVNKITGRDTGQSRN